MSSPPARRPASAGRAASSSSPATGCASRFRASARSRIPSSRANNFPEEGRLITHHSSPITEKNMPIYPEFKGRVAVVTGAAQGIGAVTALAFAKQGASVALLDIDGAGAKKVADSISSSGGKAVAIHVDVTEELSVARAVASVVTELGGFDILVNCAGGYGRLATIEDMPIEEWDRTIALNLRSVFLMSKAAIPHLKRSKAGRIINVSSITGRQVTVASSPAYGSAK